MKAIDALLQDLRYAGRMLKKSPGFMFFAVLTIALGLGANAAIFSLVDGVLLKATGYPEPERLVQPWEKTPEGFRNGISGANYLDWAAQSRSFSAMAAMTGGSVSDTGPRETRSLRVGFVSAPYFEVFGITPLMGRAFAAGEDQQGKEKVAVLSHRAWLNLFGSDPTIAGALFLVVALAACWVPAWRAARTDPMAALRQE